MRRPSFVRSLWAMASVLALPCAVHASDAKVGYLLETKAFKSAGAETPLTFTLYTDAACAGVPVAMEMVNSDALALIEPLKRTVPKGGTKVPGTSRIEHIMSGVATAPLLYLTVTGTGVVAVGDACQVQHATVNGSDTILPPRPAPFTCPPDSVRTAPGQPCIDRYEASLWDIPPGNTALVQMVKDGTATLANLLGGGAVAVSTTLGPPTYGCSPTFPGTFPYDGHYTAPLYAASVAGVKPTGCITAYQATVACQLSNKRLLTGAEWLAGGTGIIDADSDNGSTDCNTNAPGAGVSAPVNSGSRSACVSTAGTFDQIGNVYEWTLDRMSDVLTGIPTAATSIRGGYWDLGTTAALSYALGTAPNVATGYIGFRCGR